MDFEQARFNMVEQQIRTWDVLDPTVLELLFAVRREEFVPPEYRKLAFADWEIPLGFGEHMLAPKLEARLIQEAGVQREDRVLEVGTGSGYMSALLAHLAKHVYTVEIVPELLEQARQKLQAHGLANITSELGDAAHGWDTHAPYDVILVTGSLPQPPTQFERSLAPGGRLIAVVGDPPVMTAWRIRRAPGGGFGREALFETSIKPLRNAPQPERFVF
jgi:protein-L-isoaspartate(D-aspartate) O-methyltransferase